MGDAPLLRVTRRPIKVGHKKLVAGDTFTPPGVSRWEALVRAGLVEVVEDSEPVEEPKPKPKPKRRRSRKKTVEPVEVVALPDGDESE